VTLLELDRVGYRYPNTAVPALRDVQVAVEAGEFVVLAGHSGQGKSTLLRAACGLVPHFHGGEFAGRVRLAGLDTREHGPAQLGALVGVLFQDPESQLVMNTVRAELALALENRGGSELQVARGVEEAALALGIESLLDRPVRELSGGEKQRVALGAALAGRPRLLLLDEPTSQLDPVAGDELIGLLRRLNEEWDVAVVLAEHRLERCLAVADRVIAMEGGRIVHDGEPGAFLDWAASAAPALQTPAARMFAQVGLRPPPVGVRQARAVLRTHGLLDPETSAAPAPAPKRPARGRGSAALELRGVWHEIPRGPAILRGVSLRVDAGETVALMGRNGAGKSTLLRHAAGLMAPTRGKLSSAGRVALLLQNPSDYLLHDRVADEADAETLAREGLAGLAERNPRDLSGGERQRLALAIVTAGEPPAVLALDEPTRGMDREAKGRLAERLRARARGGEAVLVATHDSEFAASCAERAILMAEGRILADGPVADVLSGGWYFATETARVLGPAGLRPEEGAALLRARMAGTTQELLA
jgi:energy-coupling factor transport system ATP-binding protein